MKIDIWTDGAYSSSKNRGGIGIVFYTDDKLSFHYFKGYDNTTNNQMELIAVITALNAISKKVDKIVIHSDSQYVIGCATKGWERKSNTKLWERYDNVIKKANAFCDDITFEHVKGHEDDVNNNLADVLAVYASQNVTGSC